MVRIYQYLSSSLIAFSDKFDAFGNGNGNILILGNFISTFCYVLRYNRNGTFYKLNSLYKFFIYLKLESLGVTFQFKTK